MNAIGTQLRDPINSGLTRWRTAVLKDSIAVATNSRSMIFVTIVSYVRWCVCVFKPHNPGASLRLSVYV